MYKKTGHIITISVLILFLFYSCGNVLFFNYRLDQIKSNNNVRNEVAGNDHILSKLVIPLHEVKWEHEYEFMWNGSMYDVAEKEIMHDTLYCIAYKDTEENALKKELAEHFETKPSEKNTGNIIKLQFPDYLSSAQSPLVHPTDNFGLQQTNVLQKGRIFFAALFIPPDQN